MGERSKIGWTDATWNPVTGCRPVSAGCAHCYARLQTDRLRAMGVAKYDAGFEPCTHDTELRRPARWRRPRRIFVCSMSDLFQEAVSDEFIERVFSVMLDCPWHTFQILTKRAERLAQMAPHLEWPAHVWCGVTVEDRRSLPRIAALRTVPARVRFVSFEPLLEDLGPFDFSDIHQGIVGGESGPGARPMRVEWVRALRSIVKGTGAAFFFKQWGGEWGKVAGKALDGREWCEVPR